MIWKNGLTWEAHEKLKKEWHSWFAWHPVQIGEDDGHKIKAWLEYVERRAITSYGYGWIFDYRMIQ